MKRHAATLSIAVAAALGLPVEPALAVKHQCPEINAVVAHHTSEELALVCQAVAEASAFMRENGFSVTTPISVSVVDNVTGSFPHRAVGAYNRDTLHIEVLSYSECLNVSAQRSVFRVPMTRDLHRSFVVHEVTHAILESNFGAKPPPLAQEYVGYVAQFATMEPGLRSRILAEYDVTPFERESQINVDLYMMDPSAFGVMAWLHYRLPGNGPAFMSRILRRDVF
ncbi:MAG TPA: DUF6639 family protein [Burkholderiales bacterium]|nr:DUF6639 family protein [Burkholderiales bacterium]